MSTKSFILICLQFVTMIFLAKDTSFNLNMYLLVIKTLAIGITVWGIIAGGIFNFNVQPEVKSKKLITKAPFSLVRNPMYLGILLFFGADVIADFSLTRLLVFVALAIILLLKIFSEEKFLESEFDDTYRDYKTKSYRLIPWVY